MVDLPLCHTSFLSFIIHSEDITWLVLRVLTILHLHTLAQASMLLHTKQIRFVNEAESWTSHFGKKQHSHVNKISMNGKSKKYWSDL